MEPVGFSRKPNLEGQPKKGVMIHLVWWFVLGSMFFWSFLSGGDFAGGMDQASEQAPLPRGKPSDGWRIDCPNEGDQVKITPQKEGVLLEISSKKGIGQATVERTTGAWPKPLILRLHLRGLESLRVEGDQWGFEASVMSYPPYQTRLRVYGPDPLPPVDPKSPYWVEVRALDSTGKPSSKIPLEGGYFELTIPALFLEKAPKKLQIHWIDFYRG